jgi:nicotinamidase-related amidase
MAQSDFLLVVNPVLIVWLQAGVENPLLKAKATPFSVFRDRIAFGCSRMFRKIWNACNDATAPMVVVIIDPQNDVLSETGLAWPLVHESLKENNTIPNIERIFKAAKAFGFEVFISPHYFYPVDKGWKFNGPLETDEATEGFFARKGVLTLEGLKGSGADWLERFKPYIEDGKTIVVSPHRVWGPETNDLVLQLRKRRISKVILGGMLANMCVESHLRELLEQGFEMAVVKDATAAPKHPEWGYGYTAALINYAFLAHAVLTTDDTVKAMERGQRS